MRTRGLVLGGIVGAALVGATWFVTAAPQQRPIGTFDPDRLADLETRMWQTYYDRSRARLFRLLVVMLREQYQYSWATATEEAFHLARAASTFGDATSGYERMLRDLEHAYSARGSDIGRGSIPPRSHMPSSPGGWRAAPPAYRRLGQGHVI